MTGNIETENNALGKPFCSISRPYLAGFGLAWPVNPGSDTILMHFVLNELGLLRIFPDQNDTHISIWTVLSQSV